MTDPETKPFTETSNLRIPCSSAENVTDNELYHHIVKYMNTLYKKLSILNPRQYVLTS